MHNNSAIDRRQFIKLSTVTAACSMLPKALAEGKRKPNILFIVTDEERSWETLPKDLDLPHRQSLLNRGCYFKQHITNTAPCSPARAIIYTGKVAASHEVYDNINLPIVGSDLDPDVKTMGDYFRKAGYYTGYKGKWHLSNTHEIDPYDMPEELEKYGFSDFGAYPEAHSGPHDGYLHDARVAADSAAWIKQRAKQSEPWLLAVNLVNPHDIMNVKVSDKQAAGKVAENFPFPLKSPPDDALYQNGYDNVLPHTLDEGFADRPSAHLLHKQSTDALFGPVDSGDIQAWERYVEYYYNCLRDVDRHLGTVLAALTASGQADNTIVVFTSDHGEMAGAHGLRLKGANMYRENIGVPLVVCDPRQDSPRSINTVTSHLDLIPTLLDLTDTPIPSELKGESFASLIKHPDAKYVRQEKGALVLHSMVHMMTPNFVSKMARRKGSDSFWEKLSIVAEAPHLPEFENKGFMRGIVWKQWKFARYFSPLEHHIPNTWEELLQRNELELYDTDADPHERNNLARSPEQFRALIMDLNNRLNTIIADEVGVDDGSYLVGPAYLWDGES